MSGLYVGLCLLLLFVVLLQQGKGGDIAAAFGGSGHRSRLRRPSQLRPPPPRNRASPRSPQPRGHDCGSGGTGRRTSLRGWRWQHCGGSNPPFRTTTQNALQIGMFLRPGPPFVHHLSTKFPETHSATVDQRPQLPRRIALLARQDVGVEAQGDLHLLVTKTLLHDVWRHAGS